MAQLGRHILFYPYHQASRRWRKAGTWGKWNLFLDLQLSPPLHRPLIVEKLKSELSGKCFAGHLLFRVQTHKPVHISPPKTAPGVRLPMLLYHTRAYMYSMRPRYGHAINVRCSRCGHLGGGGGSSARAFFGKAVICRSISTK